MSLFVLHPCLPPQLTEEAGSLPLTLPEMEERGKKKSHLMYSLFLLALCVLVLWLFYSLPAATVWWNINACGSL